MFPQHTAAIQSALSLAAYSETSLLNNFKSQHQLWPIHTVTHSLPLALPQSFHPSLPLSFLWSHFTVEPSEAYPNLSIGRGPIAVQGPRELSCELSTLPSLFSWLSLYPDSSSASFRMVLDDGLIMQYTLLCTVYRALTNILGVFIRAQ